MYTPHVHPTLLSSPHCCQYRFPTLMNAVGGAAHVRSSVCKLWDCGFENLYVVNGHALCGIPVARARTLVQSIIPFFFRSRLPIECEHQARSLAGTWVSIRILISSWCLMQKSKPSSRIETAWDSGPTPNDHGVGTL